MVAPSCGMRAVCTCTQEGQAAAQTLLSHLSLVAASRGAYATLLSMLLQGTHPSNNCPLCVCA